MKASKKGKGENSLRKTGRTNFPDIRKSAFAVIFISRMRFEQTLCNLIIGSRATRNNHCYRDLTTLLWFIFHCLLTSNRDRGREAK